MDLPKGERINVLKRVSALPRLETAAITVTHTHTHLVFVRESRKNILYCRNACNSEIRVIRG